MVSHLARVVGWADAEGGNGGLGTDYDLRIERDVVEGYDQHGAPGSGGRPVDFRRDEGAVLEQVAGSPPLPRDAVRHQVIVKPTVVTRFGQDLRHAWETVSILIHIVTAFPALAVLLRLTSLSVTQGAFTLRYGRNGGSTRS